MHDKKRKQIKGIGWTLVAMLICTLVGLIELPAAAGGLIGIGVGVAFIPLIFQSLKV